MDSALKRWIQRWAPILFAALAGGFCVLFYGSLWLEKRTVWFALGYCALLLPLCRFLPRCFTRFAAALHGLGLLGAAAVFCVLVLGGSRYAATQGSWEQSVYAAPEKVMFVVPHQDDDLNLGAGVIDAYRAAGTDVKVVFLSNGDADFKDAYRLREALRCQKALGVEGENVIFLGYGDQYTSPYGHIYNAPSGELVPSDAGYTHTYGLKRHPEYRTSVSGGWSNYTYDNVVWDMQELLGTELPDVIYCIDQDFHADHKGTSLIFETALGNLLGSGADYHPMVYKGFGYSSSWMAEDDYYAANLASTLQPYESGRMEETNTYLWADRLRLPLRPADLAHTRRASALYPAFASYGSQKAVQRMGRVVNGDKVFWPRRTDSLLYTAQLSAQTPDGLWRLNDFKLADSERVADRQRRPFDGVWVPAPGDVLQVQLAAPAALQELVLYDNPSLEDNVLQARITLETGEQLLTGPLEPGGAPTRIALPSPAALNGFTLELVETEGARAGLCELEAYALPAQGPAFIKATDAQGNFVYTYTPEGPGDILLGAYGSTEALAVLTEDLAANLTATVDGKALEVKNGFFVLPCPDTAVTVRLALKSDSTVWDEVVVKPYSAAKQAFLPLLRQLDTLYCSFSYWTRYHWAFGEHALLKLLRQL